MLLWGSGGGGEDGAMEAIGQGLVDGVIFRTVTEARARSSRRCATTRRSCWSTVGLTTSRVTKTSASRIGAWHVPQYFALHGRRDIALIGGPLSASTARERGEGFRQGLADHGIPLGEDAVVPANFLHEGGREAMTTLPGRARPPVVCLNDLTAFGALDGARPVGVTVPGDLWVVGYDDIAMAAWAAFDLTTVRQPIPEMSRLAAELLLARIADPGRPLVRHRLPDQLVVRGAMAHARSASDLAAVGAAADPPGGLR